MLNLTVEPNFMPECAPIKARISAKNSDGWSVPSIINTDMPQVYYRPTIVPKPVIQVFNLTTIQLTWKKAVSNCPPAPVYEISWGQGNLDVQDALLATNGHDQKSPTDEDDYLERIETDSETTTYN